MATVVGVDCTDGALLAGDRTVVEDGTIAGSRPHVFGFDGAGAAAVGDDPDAFRRQLDVALREYSAERGEPGIDAVARMAAEIASETGVAGIVAARDEDGDARVLSVEDGVLEERVAVRGSGAQVVLGRLETLDEAALDTVESAVREAFEAAASRDAATGGELDVWRLSDR